MIPSIESLSVVLIAGVPALLLALFWHELGHWAAGRLLGRSVLACGIGPLSPWFRWRVGRTQFYFGRPFTTGITLGALRFPDRNRSEEFWFIAGGPLASMTGLAAGYVGWILFPSDVLVAWLIVSAWLTFCSMIPFTVKVGTFQLSSDAYQLLDLVRGQPRALQQPLGTVLTNLDSVCGLLERIAAPGGAAYYRLLHGSIALGLGDLVTARASLAEAQACEQHNIPESQPAAAYLAAMIALESDDPAAPELVATAVTLGADNRTTRAILELAEIEQALQRGTGDVARLRTLREEYVRSGQTDLLCTIDVLACQHDPPAELQKHLEWILAHYRHRATPLLRAQLLASATEHFANRGELDLARRYYPLAQAAIQNNAVSIAGATTREAYLRMAAAPLERAVLNWTDDVPLFLSPPEPVPAAGNNFSQAAFGFAVGALGVAIFVAVRGPSPGVQQSIAGLITGTWLLATSLGLISIGRREGKPWYVASAFVLGLIAAVVATATTGRQERSRPDSVEMQAVEDPDLE